MLLLNLLFVLEIISVCKATVSNLVHENVSNYPFDRQLYEDVLNPVLCRRQLQYMFANNSFLLFRFRDAGPRIPRGIFLGNLNDIGNYPQCLNINESFEEVNIQGKYCMTSISVDQNNLSLEEWFNFAKNTKNFDKEYLVTMNWYKQFRNGIQPFIGAGNFHARIGTGSPTSLSTKLAFCIPAVCNLDEALSEIYFNFNGSGIKIKEEFCRLPRDKPWVPADYVAIATFSTIGILVLLSTCYDLWQLYIVKKDCKDTSVILTSFSAYTNTRRLLTFKSGPDSLHCIDGVRALAMAWVVVGHTILAAAYCANPLEMFQWVTSPKAIWITGAPITVDTFFMLSGLLVVYTTAGKLTNMQLLKNIPVFYLSRLLRMFPLLAAVILYKVSLHNRIADGPNWYIPAMNVLNCRQYWWSALLHIQNYYNPRKMCLAVTWYLSVDIQLHVLSPIVLFWVLTGKKNIAWIALTAGLLTSVVAATTYVFVNNFQSGTYSQNLIEVERYYLYYYINTLTRSSPFLVGMVFGYILHLYKGKSIQINKAIVATVWCLTLILLAGVTYCLRLNLDENWNNQLADNFINSFVRPAWALGLGWVIFACAKGHGGPIDWFLSLNVWKLPARLSYAMYLIHFTVIISTYSASSMQVYFSTSKLIFDALAFMFITTVIAFVLTVTIDAPFATLFKLALFRGNFVKKTQKEHSIAIVPEDVGSEHDEVKQEGISSKKL